MEESSPGVDPDIEKVRSKTNKTNFNLEFLIVFNYDKTSIKLLGLLEEFITSFFLSLHLLSNLWLYKVSFK